MTNEITALIIDPDGHVSQAQITPTLETFQKLVGGYIEGVFGTDYVMYVNEEGIIQSLPYNHTAASFVAAGQPLYGTAVIVGPGDSEGNDTSVGQRVIDYFQSALETYAEIGRLPEGK